MSTGSQGGGNQGSIITEFGQTEVTTNDTVYETRNEAATDYGLDTYGAKTFLNESSIGTFTTSDYGAIAAGQAVALSGIAAAQDAALRATDAARFGLAEAGEAIKTKASGDTVNIIRSLGWTGVAIAALWLIIRAMAGKKGQQ